jgi:hypothetical protein
MYICSDLIVDKGDSGRFNALLNLIDDYHVSFTKFGANSCTPQDTAVYKIATNLHCLSFDTAV